MNNLWKEYKQNGKSLSVLENINLKIDEGEIISIIGPSGCGKTTLIKIIADLIQKTKGQITFENGKKSMGMVFQNPALLKWRNVRENVNLFLELKKIKNPSSLRRILSLVGLSEFKESYPWELSGGMQQRVSLARALVNKPDLLVMDEPFSSLDEIKRNELNLELLKIWNKLKTTIIIVTHSIIEAVFLSNRVIVLSERPARIKNIVKINLPMQRKVEIKETKKFQEYVKCIRMQID